MSQELRSDKISGLGATGYLLALRGLHDHLTAPKRQEKHTRAVDIETGRQKEGNNDGAGPTTAYSYSLKGVSSDFHDRFSRWRAPHGR